MVAAWLLTLFAVTGIAFGVFLGPTRAASPLVAAAGGGLLTGISSFWIMPEVVEATGWVTGVVVPCVSFGLLMGIDILLHKVGRFRLQMLAASLLAAAAIHSMLDGWSVRVLSVHPMASVAVAIGLALHKLPEGLALGMVSGRSISPPWKAFGASTAVESFTLVGALIEPRADAAGVARFGTFWMGAVLGVVCGSFLFLGVHTGFADRRRRGVVGTFVASFLIAAAGALTLGKLGLN